MEISECSQHPPTGRIEDYLPLCFVMVNGSSEEEVWDDMVRRWHYLGYNKMIGPRIKYLVLSRETPIAAISFNRASFRIGVREAWLAWDNHTRCDLLPHVITNNRFLILPWVRVKNLASHILSRSLRQVQEDWFRLYGVEPYAVETFVDLSRNRGTCYKAANWRYLGETSGYGKVGKTFVYHGNRKGVFIYLLNGKLLQTIATSPRRPDPNLVRARLWEMMLNKPDWSPELFAEAGLDEESVAALWPKLCEYFDYYSECFALAAQQCNVETYIKGLLSDLERKSIEPIALRYRDENAVRTMQMFQKDSPWDDALMKDKYQSRVLSSTGDAEGMITVDGSDHAKKGGKSAGVTRQYCGRLGKVENCQAGVYLGYSGKDGYGLLDSRLYLPEIWFDEEHRALWNSCDIPKETVFQTKPQLAMAMLQEAESKYGFPFKWVGCDGAFGCDAEFRKMLPKSVYFFADIHSNQRVFLERPQWQIPERKSVRGKEPSKLVPSVTPVPVSAIAESDSTPWEEITLMDGAKGPVRTLVKYRRVVEIIDGRDQEEVWLYIRKYENGQIKYSLSNAPSDIDSHSLHHAATLRWAIEQAFQECKSFLGMSDYETRSYKAWHRHMLLVMVSLLFVSEVRNQFQKKRNRRYVPNSDDAPGFEAHPRHYPAGGSFDWSNLAHCCVLPKVIRKVMLVTFSFAPPTFCLTQLSRLDSGIRKG